MNINPGQFLEFLQEMICKSFESELKSRKRILFYSKQKNLLIIWQGLKDGIIVTLEEYINSCGESYHLHIIDQDESFELLAQWSQKMADYLWEQSLENIPDQALIIANTYQKSFKNIVLDPFKDPDQEGNYAIATLSNLEIECLYLNESKLCWFEISDPKKNSEESSEVRQIFVPNHCNQSDFLEIVDKWLYMQISQLNPKLVKKGSKLSLYKNYRSHFLVIIGVFLFWLMSLYFSPI